MAAVAAGSWLQLEAGRACSDTMLMFRFGKSDSHVGGLGYVLYGTRKARGVTYTEIYGYR
jgi:hypothetical protein